MKLEDGRHDMLLGCMEVTAIQIFDFETLLMLRHCMNTKKEQDKFNQFNLNDIKNLDSTTINAIKFSNIINTIKTKGIFLPSNDSNVTLPDKVKANADFLLHGQILDQVLFLMGKSVEIDKGMLKLRKPI